MIMPPTNTTCYYTARFENQDAIQELLDEIIPILASDFDMALVVSIDLTSDILATNSMQDGVKKIQKRLKFDTSEKFTFNPLYLPISQAKLSEAVETDQNGKILSVGNFTDPFVTCNFQIFSENDLAVSGKVSWNEFAAHHPIETIQSKDHLS